jgi:hypothetical protein
VIQPRPTTLDLAVDGCDFTGGGGTAGTLNTATIITQATAQNFKVAGLGFTVSAIFSATNAGNLAYLDGLCLEQV